MKLTHRFAATCVLTLGTFGTFGMSGLSGQAMAAPLLTQSPVSTFCNNPVNLSLVGVPGGNGLLGQALSSLGLGGSGGESSTGGAGSSTPSQDGTPTGGAGGTGSTTNDQEVDGNRCGRSSDTSESRTFENNDNSGTQTLSDSSQRQQQS
jgi:hypothetical protein